MRKGADAFRSIGEVAKLIGVAPHVLRYWETQFPQLKPMKRPDGRRYYRPDDVRLIAGLCEVLRDDGMTIRGAKKMIAKDRGEAIRRRGVVRLGEAMKSPVAAGLAEMPDPVPEDESMPQHPPRSRHRRRRHADDDNLPLFSGLPNGQVPSGWLMQLVGLASCLRAADRTHPHWDKAAARAAALRAVIITHYETP